jgi:hypothetical protein
MMTSPSFFKFTGSDINDHIGGTMKLTTTLRTLTASLLLIFAASSAQAAWVGAFLYRGFLFDHIHVTVADADNFEDAAELNIWNNAPSINTPMSTDIASASKWILFWDNKSKKEIVDAWAAHHARITRKVSNSGATFDDRSLTDHNCAFSTEYLLEQVLGHPLKSEWTWSRVFLFIWVPKHHGRIPLAGHVLTRLKDTLKGEHRAFYTHRDAKNQDPQAFLKSLRVSP